MRKPKDDMTWVYLFASATIILLWVWYFAFFQVEWVSIGIGVFTGAMLMGIAVELSGNRFFLSLRAKDRPPK